MAILPIVTYPDPRLKEISSPVERVTDEVRSQLNDMMETMYASGGIGLAAVQVGIMQRMMVMDVDQTERGEPVSPIKLVNPEVIWESEETHTYQEGCLSFPGQYADVTRAEKVRIRYMDEQGELRELEADGLLAICIQHELDHLNGITFTDHLSRMKRDMIHRKVKKEQKLAAPVASEPPC